MTVKAKVEITCERCDHMWRTVRRYTAYCRKCGTINDVPPPPKPAVTVTKGESV